MSKAAVARAIRQRDELVRLLKLLDDRTLEDLERRGRHTPIPDGFPPGGGSEGRGSEVSRPTEAAASARIDQIPPADPIAHLITGIFRAVASADHALAGVEHALQVVRGYGAPAGRESSLQGDCQCCLRPVAGTEHDRLKAGYCPACWMAWRRAGRPDRPRFEIDRRADLAAREAAATSVRHAGDPEPAVTCDHACCDRTAIHEHWHPPERCPECALVADGYQLATTEGEPS